MHFDSSSSSSEGRGDARNNKVDFDDSSSISSIEEENSLEEDSSMDCQIKGQGKKSGGARSKHHARTKKAKKNVQADPNADSTSEDESDEECFRQYINDKNKAPHRKHKGSGQAFPL